MASFPIACTICTVAFVAFVLFRLSFVYNYFIARATPLNPFADELLASGLTGLLMIIKTGLAPKMPVAGSARDTCSSKFTRRTALAIATNLVT
jgi:hypothetical protein